MKAFELSVENRLKKFVPQFVLESRTFRWNFEVGLCDGEFYVSMDWDIGYLNICSDIILSVSVKVLWMR